MRRWIDMRTVLPRHFVKCGAEAVLGDGVRLMGFGVDGRREFRLAKARPHRRLLTETVGEIDKRLGRDDAVGVRQVRLGLRGRTDQDESAQRSKRQQRGAEMASMGHGIISRVRRYSDAARAWPPMQAFNAKPSAPKPSAPKPSAPKPSAPKPSAPKPSAPKPSAPKPS